MKHRELKYFEILAGTFFLLLFVSCSSKSSYNYRNEIKLVQPVENYGTHYSDNFIFIDFNVTPKKIDFTLKNRGEDPIEILWSGVKFTDTNGKLVPIAGRGTLFSDNMKESFVPDPLAVDPGETIEDSIVPIKSVEQLEEWVWYVKPMFNLFDDKAKNHKGKKLDLDLPIKIAGKVVGYHFTFLVYDVIPLKGGAKG